MCILVTYLMQVASATTTLKKLIYLLKDNSPFNDENVTIVNIFYIATY